MTVDNARRKKRYERQRELGLCAYGACARTPNTGVYCELHRKLRLVRRKRNVKMSTAFHDRLRLCREHAGLSPRKAAQRAGVPRERWLDYEAGRTVPSRLEVRKVFGDHARIVNEVPDEITEAAPPPPAPAPSSPQTGPVPLPPWAVAIRTERVREKLTQDDLAQILGVHASAVQHWEAGQATPIKAHALQLAEVLPGLRDVLPGGREIDKPGPRAERAGQVEKSPPRADSAAQPPGVADPREDSSALLRKAAILANALRGCDTSYGILRVDKDGVRAFLVVGGEDVEEVEREGQDGVGVAQGILDALRAEARAAREEAERRATALKDLVG